MDFESSESLEVLRVITAVCHPLTVFVCHTLHPQIKKYEKKRKLSTF